MIVFDESSQKKNISISLGIGIFLPKLFWLTLRKNCSSDQEEILKFEAEGREFAKIFEITRAINSNSERSERFLVIEYFYNLFLEVSQI